jgi:DNA-binding response OmpR family regulator
MAYKILVVDDHPATRSIICHVLQQRGYQVVNAPNGAKGVALADKEQPHLILLDYMMPVMNGIQACQTLRKKKEFDRVPIIMFTAVDDPQQKLAAFNAGADDYLNKPTEPPELIERVETLLTAAYGAAPAPQTNPQTMLQPRTGLPEIEFTPASTPDDQQIIAVMGVRGGAGTTTMSINLAAALAGGGDAVTLIDFDMTHGHVGLYLNQKMAGGVNTLATMPEGEIAAQLSSHLIAYSTHLRLLLAHLNIDGRYPAISGSQAAAILNTLSPTTTTVVDLGSSLNEVARSAIELADHIVVCLRPERIALVAARQIITHLHETIFPHTVLHVVMIDFGPGTNLPQTAVEGFLGYPVTATIQIPRAEMAQSVNKAKPLIYLSAKTQAGTSFRQFAQQLQTL